MHVEGVLGVSAVPVGGVHAQHVAVAHKQRSISPVGRKRADRAVEAAAAVKKTIHLSGREEQRAGAGGVVEPGALERSRCVVDAVGALGPAVEGLGCKGCSGAGKG